MTLRISLLFLLLFLTACPSPAPAGQDTIHGKVVRVADGDTFTMLLDDDSTIKVRLISIDCPERYQPYSNVARKFLSDAIFGREVKVVIDSKDRYGRALGWVYFEGTKWHILRQSLHHF